jgi:glycosyltransferase involved in cell wall biosynthesis
VKILYHHRIRSKDGQFVHVEELTEALKAQGHTIVFVGPAAVHREQFGADAGAVAWLKRYLPRAMYEVLELCYSFGDFIRLVRTILRERPDIIYERYNLLFPSGSWARSWFRIPFLLEVNAPLFEERSRFGGISLTRLARWSEVSVWRRADHVFPVTEVLARYVRSAGVPGDRLSVVPNGIDWRKFSGELTGAATRRELGFEGKTVVGFTGFVRDWHGLDELVRAVAEDRGMVLLVVGDGPARASTEALAAQLGVSANVKFTGVVERDRVADYVAAFDIAMQPDVVDYASPLKLIEYLALGRAIVSVDKPNIRELLTHGKNALLFEPGRRDLMLGHIRHLCHDPQLRQQLGAAARQTVHERDLTWAGNARRVIAVADNLRSHLRVAEAVSSQSADVD